MRGTAVARDGRVVVVVGVDTVDGSAFARVTVEHVLMVSGR